MAKVVYGFSGEGSGHSSRAREILPHLLTSGHEVRAVSYDRGHRNLASDFQVFETVGLHIATHDNRVDVLRTLLENLRRMPDGLSRLRAMKQELFRDFRPDCVITDFEPMTAYLAIAYDLPLITLDNQHRMRYMRYPCPQRLRKDALVTETVIRAMVPRPSVSLVTTFYFGDVKNDRTFLFPPILRRAVRDAHPTGEEHVLVYMTQAYGALLDILADFDGERFRVYGSEREGREGPLEYCGFSYEGFLADLCAAKAVISTAGFTLMTEALHLGKPQLAIPMRGQFEQELNALLLEERGYGKNGRLLDPDLVADFLDRLPEYRTRLTSYESGDNGAIQAKLDELLADDAALARELQQRRAATA